jgi:hypothetical protein
MGQPPGVPPLPPTPPVPPPLQPLLLTNLVVGNAVQLVPGDDALIDLLEANGFFISLVDDATTPDNTEVIDLVVISPSVASNTVAAKYRNHSRAVMVLDFGVFDDMRMTGTQQQTAFGTTAGRQIAIVAGQESHPLSAGLTGTVTIGNANAPMNWGQPANTANVVATLLNDPTRAVIFGYEAGVQMQGQIAPARRVAFFASDMLVDRMSPDGERLFIAAAKWAATGPRVLPPL